MCLGMWDYGGVNGERYKSMIGKGEGVVGMGCGQGCVLSIGGA